MATFSNKNASINASINQPEFVCNICDYKCCRNFDLKRHYNTNKHKINKMALDDAKNAKFRCDNCEKNFNDRSGLWRHKKKCDQSKETENIIINVEEDKANVQSNEFDSEMILDLLKQNQEFKDLILEQNKKILELVSAVNITNNNNITNNTTNNNKFNLNVFLNETCKDALNLSDFLESLILTLTDFENFGPLGYCGGISNILIKGLNQLDISKRPIHCSDLKREVIHIKNNDTWHKDDDKQQMIKAIKAIEHKNVKQMSLWAKANPEYKDPNHKKSDLYTKLIDQSLGETDKEKAQKNYNKIIRTVAKEILVDKEK
uniref:C2H2-type domain-containing protein n=1 Tax=viral metagenome TaxID=1070528 RepID=A0A6C0DET3_9ZZZZ